MITARRRHDIYAYLSSFLVWFKPMNFRGTFQFFQVIYGALSKSWSSKVFCLGSTFAVTVLKLYCS